MRVKTLAVALFGAAFFVTGASRAQQDFSKVDIKITDLGHDTFMLEGSGGNITVAAGRDGVIMVDGQFAPLHDRIKAAVFAVTGLPVRYLVNTHFHSDHIGGNGAFAGDGTTIVSQANVAVRLGGGAIDRQSGAKVPALAKEMIPKLTYADSMNLSVKGLTARLGHPAKAHTDGDTYVHFKVANVIATGDIVTLGRYPLVDFLNGGSIQGMIAAVDGYLKLANDNTRIVPGHGPLATKATLAEYRAMLATARDRVAKLIAEGKSEQEAVAARPIADIDAKLRVSEPLSANFVRSIYSSLKPKA